MKNSVSREIEQLSANVGGLHKYIDGLRYQLNTSPDHYLDTILGVLVALDDVNSRLGKIEIQLTEARIS